MTHIRLHRTQQQRTLRIPTATVHRSRRLHLHRIAQLRPRPVRLQIIHRRRRNTRPLRAPPLSPAPAPDRSVPSNPHSHHPGSPPTPAAPQARDPPPPPRPQDASTPPYRTPHPARNRPPPHQTSCSDHPMPASPHPQEYVCSLMSVSRSLRLPVPDPPPLPAAPAAAWCSATSDDEHAVSTVIAGPRNPKAKATRPIAVEG